MEAERVTQAAKAAADSEEAATGGALTAAMKEILKEHRISVQRIYMRRRGFALTYSYITVVHCAQVNLSIDLNIIYNCNVRGA